MLSGMGLSLGIFFAGVIRREGGDKGACDEEISKNA